jgi:hypothetical protein
VGVLEKGVPPRKSKDLVLVHGRTKDGLGLGVIRAREERLEIGTMRPLEEGKSIYGEVVKLTPRSEMPLLFDAETQFVSKEPSVATSDSAPPPAQARQAAQNTAAAGPPQVASDTYRKNWDAIWNRSPAKRDKLVN